MRTLTLPHKDARRLLNRRVQLLVLTRTLKPGTYEIHDQLISERNRAHVKANRQDLTTDSKIVTLEVGRREIRPLWHLGLQAVRQAGFQTQRDFYDHWLDLKGHVPDVEVNLYPVRYVDPGRYLHEKVHRGYTTNPALGARGEFQALSVTELEELTARSKARWESEKANLRVMSQARSIAARIRYAAREGNSEAIKHLQGELAELQASMEN